MNENIGCDATARTFLSHLNFPERLACDRADLAWPPAYSGSLSSSYEMTHKKSATEAGGHQGDLRCVTGREQRKGDQHRESSWLSEGLCPLWGLSVNIILKRPNSQCFLSNKISGLKEVPGIT